MPGLLLFFLERLPEEKSLFFRRLPPGGEFLGQQFDYIAALHAEVRLNLPQQPLANT